MTGENEAVEDLTKRTAVVTGANSGIGLAAALEFARRGWALGLVGRDETRLAAAAELARTAGSDAVEVFRCDFEVFDEVRDLAERLRSAYQHIDVLANNAGGVVPSRRHTVDGCEATIQANHLSPFLLSHLLRDRLGGGRIVNTSSDAHRQGRLDPDDLSSVKQRYRQLTMYGSSKQANIFFAAEAARRWPEILSTSYHPGVVRTRFGRDNAMYRFFYRYMPALRTPVQGADTLIWLSTEDKSQLTPGAYYVDRRERRPSAKTSDPATAARLWDNSVAAVGL
jgi:NAD(P)-dependent dehydrogenase (short-subunit alcohol dehydrogenase family)